MTSQRVQQTVDNLEAGNHRSDRDNCDPNSEAPILSAARGASPSRIPVWFMRQAGRSLPEYRRAREGISMLDACLTPDLAAEITCQPVRRHDVDAAVFFSDIVIPMRLAGVGVDIKPGVGPVFDEAANTPERIAALTAHRIEDTEAIERAVGLVVAELGAATPVVGFAGAPFTLAAYLVEGRPSRDHLAARTLMHAEPAAWDQLMTWCAELSTQFLLTQVRSGARLVQLFDSWVGSLSEADYRAHVLPYSTRVLDAVRQEAPELPRIHFGTNTAHLLPALAEAHATVIGVDHRTPLSEATRILSGAYPLQGNINPALLAAGPELLHAHAREVVAEGASAPGHIVNLGHGVPPTTDPQVLTDLVSFLHSLPVPAAGAAGQGGAQ